MKKLKKILTKKMEEASNAMNYERALEYKNMLNDVKITLKKQKIDLNKGYNFDMINFYTDKNYLSIVIFFVRDGLIIWKG